MKTCRMVIFSVFLVILTVLFSACSHGNTDSIYTLWDNAFIQWGKSNEDDCYGFIAADGVEAFIYNHEGELYCGEYIHSSNTQELYYQGNVYRFLNGSTTPTISPVTDAEMSQKYYALKEKIAIGIKEKIDAQNGDYKEHSTGFFGDILGDAEYPLFCGVNDQILIFNTALENELGHMAYQPDAINFVYNMKPSGKTQDHAILLLVGWNDDQLCGWEGYDIR